MYDKNRDAYILKWAKKLKFITLLGGKCTVCGCDDMRVLDFHHTMSNKENTISRMILKYNRLDLIEVEVKKCVLMCARCHLMHHHSKKITDNKRRNNKKIFLEYKGRDSCEECGWNAHQSGLEFHHNKDKDFLLSEVNIRLSSVEDIPDTISSELDKCSVLCRNCHKILHCHPEFDSFRDAIISKEIKEYKKTNHDEVIRLYRKEKMKVSQIAKYLDINKSVVSYIINK